jgi:NitT/TauT family transport system substrate-binding protein
MKRSVQILFAALLLIGLVGFLCNATAQPVEEIKLGLQPYFSNAPLFVMLEGGYFEKAGLAVKPSISLATGTELLAALMSGQYDVMGGGVAVGTFNAILRGMTVKAIADKGSNRGKQSYGWIVVRKELFDTKKITKVQDLKGKKVAEPGVGSASWIELGMILAKYGMSFNDITVVKMAGPDTVNALKAGTIDAALISEPSVAQAKTLGAAVELASVGEELGEHQEAIIMTTEDAIKKRRPALERFLKAYVQGIRDYFKEPKRRQYLEAISKYSKIDPNTLANCYPPYISQDARMSQTSLQQQLDWLVKGGHVKSAFPLDKLVDESLLPR